MSNPISLVVGSGEEQGNEKEEVVVVWGGSGSPEDSRSVVVSSHPPANYRVVQSSTQTVHTPLANYPTAFAIEWHGLAHHRYERVFDASCSVCVRADRGKTRGSNAERGARNLETKWEAHRGRGREVFVPQDKAGGKVRSVDMERA